MQERNLNHLAQQYNGKTYYAEPEKASISCKGCVFLDEASKRDGVDHCKVPVDADHCKVPADAEQFKEDCYYEQIVWKEVSVPMLKKTKDEEPKFTVEQVLIAAKMYAQGGASVFYPEAAKCIEQYLMKQDDPDYQLYLELKAKYES